MTKTEHCMYIDYPTETLSSPNKFPISAAIKVIITMGISMTVLVIFVAVCTILFVVMAIRKCHCKRHDTVTVPDARNNPSTQVIR